MVDVTSFPDFGSAARATLEYLRAHTGLDAWAVGRWDGEYWVALEASENDVGLRRGATFLWSDSLCTRMVAAEAPRIAPDCEAVQAYRDAPIQKRLPVAAYAGAPLTLRDGTLFGTLCGFSATPASESLRAHEPLLTLLARLLAAVVDEEMSRTMRHRELERAAVPGLIDRVTGLWNRPGFELLLESEEARCARFGHAAAVMTLHVPPQPDETPGPLSLENCTRVARLLRSVVRTQDVIGRISEREFVVLAVECDRTAADALLARARARVDDSELFIGLGFARRDPAYGLAHAWQMAQRSVVRAT
jgi:GGDEF domain-containing protein